MGPRAGEFILTDAGPTSASAFEWFVDSVVARADGGRRDRDALFDLCNREVAQTRASDAIPYFLPYLHGRLDAGARLIHRPRLVARAARNGARHL
jgi:hypothetical protein